jgi:hypothetical protein
VKPRAALQRARRGFGLSIIILLRNCQSLAGYESRFTKIETDLAAIRWMLGVVMAGVASLLV